MQQAKKNILFLSYSDTRYDGRLRELYNVAEKLGQVYSVIKNNERTDSNNFALEPQRKVALWQFIKLANNMAERMPSVDIIFIDNRIACIPGLILKKKFRNAIIIQDVRELYISSEQKRIKAKIGCWIEKKIIEQADAIICANKFRAQKMKKLYNINGKILVYENVRKLSYHSTSDIQSYEDKYKQLFKDTRIKIISTSGYTVSRTNDKLLYELKDVEKDIDLLMVGGGSENDKKIIKRIISQQKLDNVHMIEKVEEAELKYLISKSQIGLVNYGQFDTNNRLCASGKIYEFLFEGLPVVTTSNLPLKDFCDKHQIGVAHDSYAYAINKIISHYDDYKDRVREFTEKYDVGKNNNLLLEKLITAIER